MSGHVLPKKIYFGVFGVLAIGTLVTVAIAHLDLGLLNTPLALGIAGFKAMMVVLYFMHVRYSEKIVGLFAACSALWVVIMLAFLLSDYLSRGWQPVAGW